MEASGSRGWGCAGPHSTRRGAERATVSGASLAPAPSRNELAIMVAAFAGLALLAAWVLLFLQVDPVPTWFYVFAWYPTLVLADEVVRRRSGSRVLFSSPARAASLFGWSAIVWLVFEVANFRLRNWYYVFLPANAVERWAGILISFATVVPAVLVAERLLDTVGIGRAWRGAPLRATPRDFRVIQILGIGMAVLALGLPRTFFPLTWGAGWLIADPWVQRHRPEWSLLGDITRGEWGRIGRLMLGGLCIGLVWECLNFWARGKWVYTVPWIEGTKLFEMPPLGFLGFPFFALEAWAMWHVLSGQAVRRYGGRAVAVTAAVLFASVTLLGMERMTISSVTPRLAELPGIAAKEVEALAVAGFASPFTLTAATPNVVAARSGLLRSRASALVERSRLVTLRGIGSAHAARLDQLGVATVCALARQMPGPLWLAYHGAFGRAPPKTTSPRPTPAEVRVWVGAARRECVEG